MKNEKKQTKITMEDIKTKEAFREFKIKSIMEYHDVSEIVAECILDAMEEAKAEYNRVSSMIQDCYPGSNTVH